MNKAGFVSIIGRPNSGKSTLLNTLINEQIALVSHKVNATRKRMNIIVMHNNAQIVFIDTPGIHHKEKILNQFMLQESIKAINDCDLIIFLAPITDNVDNYINFLNLSKNKKHLLVLSKMDTLNREKSINKIIQYEKYKDKYLTLIPISSAKHINLKVLLDEIIKYLPESPYLYDTEVISTQNIREIYKEKIREALFDNLNQEIPYQSDVIIKKIQEKKTIDKIYAEIVVEKDSQRVIVIGKNGKSIKNIGIHARKKIEQLSDKKILLKLEVITKKGWSKNKKQLKEMGYDFS